MQLTTWEMVGVVLGCIPLGYLILSCFFALNLLTVSRIKLTREEEDEIEQMIENDYTAQISSDKKTNVERVSETYKIHEFAFIIVKREEGDCRALLIIGSLGGATTNIVTRFTEGVLLITSDKRGLHESPSPPGQFFQTYQGADYFECLKQHHETEECIQRYLGIETLAFDGPDDVWILEMIKSRVHYVRSIPFWYFKIAYWYFFRRGRMNGLSVEEQHRRGIIDLVNAKQELGINAVDS